MTPIAVGDETKVTKPVIKFPGSVGVAGAFVGADGWTVVIVSLIGLGVVVILG